MYIPLKCSFFMDWHIFNYEIISRDVRRKLKKKNKNVLGILRQSWPLTFYYELNILFVGIDWYVYENFQSFISAMYNINVVDLRQNILDLLWFYS